MPGIQWGQLSPIAPPQVVASVAPQPNDLNQLAGGAMSGLLQGQQMQQNSQAMQLNDLKLQAAKQEQQLQQTTPTGNAGSPDSYIKAVAQHYINNKRPDLAMAMLQGQQSLITSTIGSQKALLDMNEQKRKNSVGALQDSSSMAVQLTNLPDQQAVDLYNNKKQGDIFRRVDPDAPKPGTDPQKILAYLHGAAAAGISVTNQIASNPMLAAALSPTEEGKQQIKQDLTNAASNKLVTPDPLVKLQDERSVIKAKIDNGTATDDDQQRYLELNNKIKKDSDKGIISKVTDTISDAVGGAINGVANLANSYTTPKATIIPDGRVRVIAPDGTIGHIPASQLKAAKAAGYKQ